MVSPWYGRAFGRQLEALVKSSLVEYRIFQGESGRGGNITRIRVRFENENVKKYIEQLTSGQGRSLSLDREVNSPPEAAAPQPQVVVA